MADKLFFLEHLPPGKYVFVDFVCGDGSMIDALADIFGNGNAYIGYDISEKMIEIVNGNFNGNSKNISFTSLCNEFLKKK